MEKRKSIKTNAVLNIIRQFGKILFPLITFPYISRVLQAENYGKINFANSIISYFILLASFGASSYSIREGAAIRNDKKKIQEFSSQIFTINMISTLVSYALLALLMIFWEKMDEYRTLMLVLSGGIILTTLGVDWLYNIYEDYLYITVRSLAIQLLSLILMFIFVKKADDYIIYAWITVFASGCGNLFNFFHSRVYVKLKLTVRPMLKKHLKPMLVLFSNTIMITIYVSSDVTILGILENDTVVGIYSVAVKIYTLVKNIFNAIIVVTLPRLSYFIANGDQKAYKQLSEKIFKGLLVLALPTLLGLGALSKNAILIISGEEYLGGQQALRILCLALGLSVFATFFTTSVLLPHKREKKTFWALIVSAFANIVLNFIFIPFWGINGAAVTTVIAEGLVVLISARESRDIFNFRGCLGVTISVLTGCAGILLVCLAINYFNLSLIPDTLLKMALSVLVYFAILLIAKNEIVLEMVNAFKAKVSKKKA